MNNDKKISISIGASRWSMQWTQTTMLWSELCDRLKTPVRTEETVEEYHKMKKADKGKLKDIGGFVGGTLSGLQRKAINVTGRDLITLDLDSISPGDTDHVVRTVDSLGMAYAIYSTRSHTEHRPRLRVVVPTDRTMTVDEYEPIARKLASLIGIGMCDGTTFEASRLMYWPSCPKDAQYVFHYGDKRFLSADGMLGLYDDWHDVRSWPQVPGHEASQRERQLLAKQGDPKTKHGIVGAFCRVYNIREALDEYLPHAYTAVEGSADRLTFATGSTVAGAVIYDDGQFLYSHHNTDPGGGQLVNAFDLVRLHKFHDLDETAKDGTPVHKLPSYTAMSKLVMQDNAVVAELNAARAQESAQNVFADLIQKEEKGKQEITDLNPNALTDVEWMKTSTLRYDDNGRVKPTLDNMLKILVHDQALSGRVAYDRFASRYVAKGALPWNMTPGTRLWTDADDAGLRWYLENKYEVTGRDKVQDAMIMCAEQNGFNEVLDYLNSLKWDGIERLDKLFIDYLGAEDNVYTRAVARKSLTAAVARAFEPGCKYDTMPILIGRQGAGKSTLIRTMGKKWYADGLSTFEGKEAAENIQGKWIIEAGEMAGYTRAEENASKQFLSRQVDVFRQAYGRRTQEYPRRCVFFGSSNQYEFLKDITGNRRFWPVDIEAQKPTKNVYVNLPGEVDQIWAEAVVRYKNGESLIIEDNEAALKIAETAREAHMESNSKQGLINEFLLQKVPKNWNTMSRSARRTYLTMGSHTPDEDLEYRDRICAVEVWYECFGQDPARMKKVDTREINQILMDSPYTEGGSKVMRFGEYGKQRGFKINQEKAEKAV
ncbi:virulence-associated E family protein [Megasphaera micronuciformis]|uniref:Virulence-associated protein E n=1 Tax=Megasphaera micronuciformis F0359 TaxID=706434 RepID=E2ZAD6_9FIRM|nr:virulence-associated E family protein [Megasphaera micronuciformis]EFQ04647.1 Virulence-associated protein E [Megasphaera micronuciformis F0359]